MNPSQQQMRPLSLYDDSEVDIPPKREKIREERVKSYRIVKINDPNDFYMIEDDGINWIDEMQEFYNSGSKEQRALVELFKIRGVGVVQNRCYVWKNPNENKWYRVRVQDANPGLPGPPVALVLLVDINFRIYADTKDFMEIHPKFSKYSVLEGFPASLIHIKPLKGLPKWSEVSINGFKTFCPFQKLYNGVIISKIKDKSQMIFYESTSQPPRWTLQCKMIQENLADPTGFGCGRPDLIHDYWSKDFLALKKVRMSEADKKLLGNAEMTPPTQRYFSTLFRGPVNSPTPSTKNHGKSAMNSAELMQSKAKYLPNQLIKSLAWIVVSSVVSPARFYFQMRPQNCEMENMMVDLKKLVETQPILSNDQMKPGDIVAALIPDEKQVSHWCRVVIKSIQKNHVEVILIDFGIEKKIPFDNLKTLPEYFFKIPPYCQRAHLDLKIKVLKNPTSKYEYYLEEWPVNLVQSFRDYVQSWITEDTHYYAWQPRGQRIEGKLELEQFDQDLYYDREFGQWVPGYTEERTDYEAIDEKREDFLLRHLYTSVGLDFVYETRQLPGYPYKFDPIWENLERKFVKLVPIRNP